MQFPSTRALDSLDVAIPSGVTGLVGANGAGKTTLISLVLGLLTPTSGSINVLGLDPRERGPELRAQIGYGPERNVFPDDLRAYDFVRHLAEVKGLPRDEARSRASDSLYLVGLGEERFRALGTMSTGQRQRVKLAQAIAADPRLIVLDEPTDGLDPVQRDEMLNIIVQVNRNFGIDVMLSSHVLEEVERVCDHVVALAEGKLVAQGSMLELAGAKPGRGGVSRGPGSAPVQHLNKTDESMGRFKAETFKGRGGDPTVPVAEMYVPPTGETAGPAPGGRFGPLRRFEAGDERLTWRSRLLPRHSQVLQRYFDSPHKGGSP